MHCIAPQNVAAYARDPYVLRPMGGGAIFYGRHKSGDEFPAEIYLSPLRRADELLVMAAIRDVSPRVKLEEELRCSRDELDERVRVRTAELEETAKRLLSEKEEHTRASARVRQAARPRTDAIEIAVIDNRHGLKAESVDRLFDTFYTRRPGHEGRRARLRD